MKRLSRLVAMCTAVGLAVPMLAVGLSATAANADQTTDYLLASSGFPGAGTNGPNASDPDVEPCFFGQAGYCMYTSQDLGSGGSSGNNFPMNSTLGFFSTDGINWQAEGNETVNGTWGSSLTGVIFNEAAIPSTYWTGGTVYPKHLWAPNVVEGDDGNYYLYDPDTRDSGDTGNSSRVVVAESSSPFGPFNVVQDGYGQIILGGNSSINTGYFSDPDVLAVGGGYGGGSKTRYMVGADGDGTNCGGLILGQLDNNMTTWDTVPQPITIAGIWPTATQISHGQTIDGFGPTGSGKAACTSHPYYEGPQLYYTYNWGVGSGVPGPYLLTFAAVPAKMPAQCATNYGQPGTANEVIAYATASSIDVNNPTFTYGGILMCGSSTTYTNQASLAALPNNHIGIFYHDSPSGSYPNRKVHGQCVAYGNGAFATATRPQSISQGVLPTFGGCLNGSMDSDWILQDPRNYLSNSQVVNNNLVSSVLNMSGYTNGQLAVAGRTAAGLYETYHLVDSNGTAWNPNSAWFGGSSTWNGMSLQANANGKYVTRQSDGTLVANSAGRPNNVSVTFTSGLGGAGPNGENLLLNIGGQVTTLSNGKLTTGSSAVSWSLLGYQGD